MLSDRQIYCTFPLLKLYFQTEILKESWTLLIYLQLIDEPEDRELFIQLYNKHRVPMYNRANRILRNQQDSEDAVHDAFIKIAENIEKISRLECHKRDKYIVTIIENISINAYRRKRGHPTEPLFDLTEYSVVDTYEDGDFARCILKLPHDYREIVLLKYDLGFSNKEIAATLNISQEVVRKRLQRARDALRRICEKEGIYDVF